MFGTGRCDVQMMHFYWSNEQRIPAATSTNWPILCTRNLSHWFGIDDDDDSLDGIDGGTIQTANMRINSTTVNFKRLERESNRSRAYSDSRIRWKWNCHCLWQRNCRPTADVGDRSYMRGYAFEMIGISNLHSINRSADMQNTHPWLLFTFRATLFTFCEKRN